jgi:hypothetical protein
MAHLRLENRHTGEVLELRRQNQNGELVLELRGALPAHQEGPPLHVHHLEDEEGVVTAGTRPVVDLDRYLHAIFEVMNAGRRNRPPLFYLAHLALRHRRTQVVLLMALPVQTILFRVLTVLGTLLGCYRGTAWPGCPARCTGAPEVASEDG